MAPQERQPMQRVRHLLQVTFIIGTLIPKACTSGAFSVPV
jgi:hypothetical protein